MTDDDYTMERHRSSGYHEDGLFHALHDTQYSYSNFSVNPYGRVVDRYEKDKNQQLIRIAGEKK